MPRLFGTDGIRGKANALGPDVLQAISDRLDEAGDNPVVLCGRDGRFSGGFDLSIMGQGGAAGAAMVIAGGQLSLKIGRHGAPVRRMWHVSPRGVGGSRGLRGVREANARRGGRRAL